MKTISNQTKDFAMMALGVGIICIALSLFSGCAVQGPPGADGQSITGPMGPAGAVGSQGNGAGVLTTEEPTACAGNGGVQVVTFLDPTNTGVYYSGDTITSTSLVCNGSQGVQGVQGQAGSDGTSSTTTLAQANATQCPTGGWIMTVTNGNNAPVSYPVCNGLVGATGQTGQTGATGQNGSNGVSCGITTIQANQAAPNGGSLITCGNTQSLVLNGAPGPQGETGPTGPAGSPGSVITPVKFCPGTSSYPNEFNELGFCIGGNLYAVYSANGGFLTEVLPGEWSSDGINASCDFTVGPNCTISNN
jgi:hypothetical protein